MPKSIIREYDNSNRALELSANFAVFVPGLASKNDPSLINEAKKAGIYYAETNIYKLNSVEQFDKYIGKCAISNDHIVPEAAKPEKVDASSESELIDNYIYHIDIWEAASFDETKYNYYTVESDSPTQPTTWSTIRRLWVVANITSDGGAVVPHYYKLAEFSKEDMEEWLEEHPTQDISSLDLIKINVGNEGINVVDGERHLGNTIARELLNVGYTVYYKVLENFDETKPETTTVLAQLLQKSLWAPLKDKSTYRIRYLISGGCYNYNVYEHMADVANFDNNVDLSTAETLDNATGRGDCIALLDIDETNFGALSTPHEIAKAFGDEATLIGSKIASKEKYCAIFAPRVVYSGGDEDFDVKYPASFNYLLCAAKARENFAEWWAAAGYTRGVSYKNIEYTTYNFGDLLINTLAPRIGNSYTKIAINLILNERGNYYLWGNRTAKPIDTTKDDLLFSHFLNVRQLCTTLKQTIYEATRHFTFDPNSDVLWINFVNAIRPTLERMKGDQGIRGYKISKVATDKKAVLMAKIRIVPIEAIEDFDISVYLENSIEGIIVDANETVAD